MANKEKSKTNKKEIIKKIQTAAVKYNTVKAENNDLKENIEKEQSNNKKLRGLAIGLGIFGALATAAAVAAPLIVLANQSTPTPTPIGSYKINKTTDEGIESVSFEVDGKTVDTAQPGQIVKVIVKEKEDYAITSLTYNGIEIREAKTFTMPNAECNVNIKTTINVAYITLELNGGTTEGSTVIKLPKGEYFGYADLPEVYKANSFEGEWYLDKEMTKLLTPDTIINESTTIYKNWFNKFTDAPNCFGIHANEDSQLLAFYEAVEESNSASNEDEGLINISTLEYSTDGNNWEKYPIGASISLPQGKNIYFRAEKSLDKSAGIGKSTRLLLRGNVSLGGNVLGLYDKGKGEITSVQKMGLHGLFKGSEGIKTVSKDFLPATEIGTQGCQMMFEDCINMITTCNLPASKLYYYAYADMFKGCTSLLLPPASVGSANTNVGYVTCIGMFKNCSSLLVPPELPATELDEYCYQEMFANCTNLRTLPTLPATKMTTSCYDRMFQNDINITSIPEDYFKHVTHVSFYCYNQMFEGCTALTNAVVLPAEKMQYYDSSTESWIEYDAIAQRCYDRMFNGCKKLTIVPENMLPATKLAPECYAGMFQNCEALQYVPKNLLPATDLTEGENCYQNMFYKSGIVSAPALPAETLAEYCYNNMFAYCNNLVTAPDLPAEKLYASCYKAMFYNCSSLKSASVGSSDPAKRIQVSWETANNDTYRAEYCCHEMFNKCTSLEEIKVNYDSDFYGSYFKLFLANTNSNLVLYYDGPSSYWNNDYIEYTTTIKPFSNAKVFVQILPTDYVDATTTDSSSLLPYRYPQYDTVVSYETKYGVTGDSRNLAEHCRFTYDKDKTIGEVLSEKIIYDNIAYPKPGCYIDRYECYDSSTETWKTVDTSTTTKLSELNSGVSLRAVFAPTDIVTCDWEELITEINKLYTPTTAEDYATAVAAFCEHFKDEDHGFTPSKLQDFVGITKQISLNGQEHKVIVVDTEKDTLVNAGTSYLKKSAFTFQFQNVISDEDGYSLGTTWNGAGDNSSALDYTNSDLRKSIDGQGDGTIRWYRKSETTQTQEETYKNKSVLDMMVAAVPTITSNMKEVTKTTRKGTTDESGNITWTNQNYNTTLFIPNRNEMNYGYRLYGSNEYYWTSSTYVLRQVKAYDGSISSITTAQGDEGTSNTISNVAGLNYNQDWFYGTSYWLSSPWEWEIETGYEQGHCVCIYTYDGYATYETCDKWALPVAPMFCI